MDSANNLCRILDCCGTKILYNGFDNTLTEFDGNLHNSSNADKGIYAKERFAGVSCEYGIDYIKMKSSNGLRHVLISMTEECNLRCKYCSYHDNRYTNNKPPKTIDEDTLRIAMDFIASHSAGACDTLISFYGGEPLLELDSIKFAIEYVEKKNCFGHKYRYQITTNGTFLDSEAVDYLVSKDVVCVISFDGPVYIHDRYRVYKDNSPTYSDVINNIKRIAKTYPQYYENNIRINAVVSPPYSRLIPKDYFEKSNVIHIDVAIGDYFSRLLESEYGSIDFTETANGGVYPEIEDYRSDEIFKKTRFIEALKKFERVGEKDERSLIFPSGFCLPLVRRIHIGVDGRIILCERVNESKPQFHFGDVFTGYDYSCVDALYEYTMGILAGNCDKCWAFRFCGACFATLERIDYDGDYCKKFRKWAEQGIINYLNLKFYNKRFDSVMQAITSD